MCRPPATQRTRNRVCWWPAYGLLVRSTRFAAFPRWATLFAPQRAQNRRALGTPVAAGALGYKVRHPPFATSFGARALLAHTTRRMGHPQKQEPQYLVY